MCGTTCSMWGVFQTSLNLISKLFSCILFSTSYGILVSVIPYLSVVCAAFPIYLFLLANCSFVSFFLYFVSLNNNAQQLGKFLLFVNFNISKFSSCRSCPGTPLLAVLTSSFCHRFQGRLPSLLTTTALFCALVHSFLDLLFSKYYNCFHICYLVLLN